MLRTLFAFALLATAASASADSLPMPELQNMTVAQFLTYHDQVAADLETKKFDYVKDAKRDAIAKQQALIRKHLAGHRALAELNDSARLAVFNAHQEVIAILDDAELDKVSCKKLHQIGSRRPKLVCETERERREIAERTRDERLRTRTCGGVSCTGG